MEGQKLESVAVDKVFNEESRVTLEQAQTYAEKFKNGLHALHGLNDTVIEEAFGHDLTQRFIEAQGTLIELQYRFAGLKEKN